MVAVSLTSSLKSSAAIPGVGALASRLDAHMVAPLLET
jgi:hypothetical protein